MDDITEKIPFLLSARTVASQATTAGILFDVSIGGVSFVCAPGAQQPVKRESAPFKKDQFDTSAQPGEQSLSTFWVRSQDSWHLGAHSRFYEPGNTDRTKESSVHRFWTSNGVNVWEPGQLTLHKAMVQGTTSTGPTRLASVVSGSTDAVVLWNTNGAGLLTAAGGYTAYTITAGDEPGSNRIAIVGANAVWGNGFGVHKVAHAGGATATLYTQALNDAPEPYYLKQRLMVTRKNNVYELAQDGSTSGGNLDTATALFSHPDPAWRWTSMTETPGAILAAGHSSGISGIYSFTLETDSGGSVPKLGQPFQVAEFPPGETVQAIRVYLGAYIGIGTSRGLRVGQVDAQGHLQYGPLLLTTAKPVQYLAARDSYLYATVETELDGKTGLVRVDLGSPIDGLLFPYALDVNTKSTAAPTGLAFLGNTDRPVVGIQDAGYYVTSATAYEPTGYLRSGFIRFGTTEPKLFRSLDVRADTSNGAVAVSVLDPLESELNILTLSSGADGSNLSLARLPAQEPHVAYKVTLTAGTSNLSTPIVNSVAVKALPAPKRTRFIQYPLIVADRITDSRGNTYGANGYGWKSVQSVEHMEETQTIVPVTDHRTGESFEAIIEQIQYAGTSPRLRGGDPNVGGTMLLMVRKL